MEDRLTELTQWYRDRIDKLAHGEKVDFNLHPGAISWMLGEAEKAEELQDKVEELENDSSYLSYQIGFVMTENERYKQALNEIVNIDGRFTAMDDEFDSNIAYDWVDEIARQALKGVEGYERD